MSYFKRWFLKKKRKFNDDDVDYPDDYFHGHEDDELEDAQQLPGDNDDKSADYIRRPPSSKKIYKSIVLGNGLTVLLISDKSTGRSAATMSVRFGSIDDPKEMMGLAHLMEHMLFNGTKANPEENAFRRFVQMNGGNVSAFTDLEYSAYSFAVDTCFESGLEMFANMFISPLMDVEHLKSEIKTINQEFELHKCNDSNRMDQLFAHTSPEDHPFNRFTCGNSSSLSKHEPEIIRDSAINLFGKHFVASCMKLVIVGADPVQKLERWVMKYFSGLKSGPEIKPAFPKYEPYQWKYGLWKHATSYIVESLEGFQVLKISWIIPPVSITHSERRPEKLIQQLICDGSQGSLYSFFKSKQWITSITALVGHESTFSEDSANSYSSTLAGQRFMISMDITDSGLEHKYDIVTYVYQYFRLLKTIDNSQSLSSYIQELKSLMRMKFECLELDSDQLCGPAQFSVALAVNMLKFPVTHAISLDFDYDFGDVQALKEMLGNFIIKNMRIDILSKPFTKEEEGILTEPYFSTKYKEESIPESHYSKWPVPEVIDSALHLPLRNELMPTRFWEVLHGPLEEDNVDSSFECIVPKCCFYKNDNKALAKASLMIYLNPGEGVISHMISCILFEMVKLDLTPLLLKGDDAYISSDLSFGDDNTIQLQLSGFGERFKDFISFIWEKFKSFEPTEECFKIITEKMHREFDIDSHDIVHHAARLLSEAVTLLPFTMEDKTGVLKFITFGDLRRLLPTLLSEPRIVGVFSGKLSKEDCIQICNVFQPVGDFEIQTKCMREFSHTSAYKVSAIPIPSIQKNCLAKVYFQMSIDDGHDVFNADNVLAFLYLFKAIVTEKLYCDLRLKQRLGYRVGCDVHNLHGTIGFYFYVVSPDHKPKDLLKKLHDFIVTIPDYLASVDDVTFRSYRSGVSFPDDSGISPGLVHNDCCINGSYGVAERFLEDMRKKKVIKLFDHFFVQMPLLVEVCIG